MKIALLNPQSEIRNSKFLLRIAQREDAERITTVINSAFRRAEGFFVDGDRIDVGSVLNYLNSGKFLLAESEGTLLGCVYVEPRVFVLNEGSPAIHDDLPAPDRVPVVRRAPADPEKEDSDLVSPTRNSQSETRNPKFSRTYLGLLAVDPAHQQRGLGSALMDAAEDYCRGLGASFMDIKVVHLRADLPAYYRRRGYVETGTSPFPADIETKLPCHFIEMSKPLQER